MLGTPSAIPWKQKQAWTDLTPSAHRYCPCETTYFPRCSSVSSYRLFRSLFSPALGLSCAYAQSRAPMPTHYRARSTARQPQPPPAAVDPRRTHPQLTSSRCVIDVIDTRGRALSRMQSAVEGPQPQGEVGAVGQSNARDSALALELEIERMRKIIREREENKLRKQAVRGHRTASRKIGCLTRAITMRRWCQVGPRLFLFQGIADGVRAFEEETSEMELQHRARPRTRSRDLRAATTKRPRMVRSFFSPHLADIWALLGSEALVSHPGANHV